MRCHYTHADDGSGPYFIPGCWGAAVHGPTHCDCRIESFEKFEKQRFNELSKQQQIEIKYLTDEVIRLNRIIRTLKKKMNN